MLNKKDAQRRKERAGGSPVSGMAQFRGSHCYLIMSWGREPTTVGRRLEGSKRNHGLSLKGFGKQAPGHYRTHFPFHPQLVCSTYRGEFPMTHISKLGQGKGISAVETSVPPEIFTSTEAVSKPPFSTSMCISVTPATAPFSAPCHFPAQSLQISIIMETDYMES